MPNWFRGIKLITPDNAFASTNSPIAAPADYVDVVFNAPANTPYTIWLRVKALNNSKETGRNRTAMAPPPPPSQEQPPAPKPSAEPAAQLNGDAQETQIS